MDETATQPAAGAQNEPGYEGPTPPYIAFTTFQSMLDRLREHGVPQVFDGSFFGNISGSTIALHRSTFKAFGLMADDKTPTSRMHALATAGDDQRKEMLADIGRAIYASCIQLGEKKGTTDQLAGIFRNQGITGETVNKAIAFYLAFADYAGYPLSPFFQRGRTASGGASGGVRRSRKRNGTKPPAPSQPPEEKTPVPSGTRLSLEDEQKVKYIELLMKLAAPEQGGEVNFDILDRIERMLNARPASDSDSKPSD